MIATKYMHSKVYHVGWSTIARAAIENCISMKIEFSLHFCVVKRCELWAFSINDSFFVVLLRFDCFLSLSDCTPKEVDACNRLAFDLWNFIFFFFCFAQIWRAMSWFLHIGSLIFQGLKHCWQPFFYSSQFAYVYAELLLVRAFISTK